MMLQELLRIQVSRTLAQVYIFRIRMVFVLKIKRLWKLEIWNKEENTYPIIHVSNVTTYYVVRGSAVKARYELEILKEAVLLRKSKWSPKSKVQHSGRTLNECMKNFENLEK